MTITPERRTATLSELVAEEIRALMGRRRMTQAQLARGIGKTEMWVSLRLRGRQPIDLNDLALIAGALDAKIPDLLPQSLRAATGQNLPLTPVTRSARVTSTGRPVRRSASRPPVSTRRDPVRPVSAIPADHRRPQPMRSAERRRAA